MSSSLHADVGADVLFVNSAKALHDLAEGLGELRQIEGRAGEQETYPQCDAVGALRPDDEIEGQIGQRRNQEVRRHYVDHDPPAVPLSQRGYRRKQALTRCIEARVDVREADLYRDRAIVLFVPDR